MDKLRSIRSRGFLSNYPTGGAMHPFAVVNESKSLTCAYVDTFPQAINAAQTEKVVFPQDRIVVEDRRYLGEDGNFLVIYPR
jgi:hypothetical protein